MDDSDDCAIEVKGPASEINGGRRLYAALQEGCRLLIGDDDRRQLWNVVVGVSTLPLVCWC